MVTDKRAVTLPRHVVWLVTTRSISALGTSLTTFGLDVWVFRSTGSYRTFAYLALIATLPGLLLAPFAGLLVDRCDKRKLLVTCELVPLLAVLGLLWQHARGTLSVSGVAATILLLSIAAAVRWTVMGVTISLLVPAENRGRINGLQESFRGVTTVLGPALGGIGLEIAGLVGLLACDALTCLGAAVALVALRSEKLKAPNKQQYRYANFWSEVTFGLRWVFRHAGLLRLMLFFTFFNLGVSVFSVVFTPYLLTFTSSRLLGWSLASQGGGAFLMGLFLARRRGRTHPESNVLGGALVFGVLMVVWGLTKNAFAVLPLAFGVGALTSLIMSSSQTIWQAHVPVEIQGKVFSTRMLVSFSLAPVAILASIPLSIWVFDPLVRTSSTASALWGAPPGGALGMMVSTLGTAVVLGCTVLVMRDGLTVDRQLAQTVNVGRSGGHADTSVTEGQR